MMQFVKAVGIGAFTFVLSSAAMATSVTVSGSVSRGTAVTSFDVEIKVIDAGSQVETTGDMFTNRVRFYIPKVGSAATDWVPVTGTKSSASMVNYQITQVGTPSITPKSTANLFDIVFKARVESLNGVIFNSLYESKTLKVQAKYSETGFTETSPAYSEIVSLQVSVQVARTAPTNFRVSAAREAVAASYASSSTATFSDGQAKTVTAAVLVVIDETKNVSELPAMLFVNNPDAEGDTDAPVGTCSYDPNFVDGNQCVTCDDANAYLHTARLQAMGGIGSGLAVVTTSNMSVDNMNLLGLTIGRRYSTFMYYEPGGLQRTGCYHSVPESGCDLAECVGDGPSKLDNPRCFIATAAYGSPLHKNLKYFTWFRDQVLLKTELGSQFVHWYYKNGPAAAAIVAKHPALAWGARTLLWFPALLISLWLSLMNHDPLAYALLAAALLSSAALAMRIRRNKIAQRI